jgi:hypothetical protein
MTLVNLANWHYQLSHPELAKLFELYTELSISKASVIRILAKHNIYKYKGRFKPYLTQDHKDARLKWCLDHQHWTVKQWQEFNFTDESGIHETGKKQVWVFRRPEQAADPKFILRTK